MNSGMLLVVGVAELVEVLSAKSVFISFLTSALSHKIFNRSPPIYPWLFALKNRRSYSKRRLTSLLRIVRCAGSKLAHLVEYF